MSLHHHEGPRADSRWQGMRRRQLGRDKQARGLWGTPGVLTVISLWPVFVLQVGDTVPLTPRRTGRQRGTPPRKRATTPGPSSLESHCAPVRPCQSTPTAASSREHTRSARTGPPRVTLSGPPGRRLSHYVGDLFAFTFCLQEFYFFTCSARQDSKTNRFHATY